jgi:hypothetical protein
MSGRGLANPFLGLFKIKKFFDPPTTPTKVILFFTGPPNQTQDS